jgi:flagellar motor component MotA
MKVKLHPLNNFVMQDEHHLREFMNREDNRNFLKTLANEESRLRAEGLMKLEYLILKEREKNNIVKDYLDQEIKKV